MGQHILPGNPPVEVNLKRSIRARRISLRVSGLDGRVTLTLPRGVSEREGLAFAREKADWLRGHLDRQAQPVSIGIGASLPVEGVDRTIRAGTGRGLRLEGDALIVPGSADTASRRIAAWLKALARDRLAEASDRHAAALGRRYTKLTLRDTRSRWGSCTADGGLMYSWRLILAPPEILDYVAAHEVAHLAEMNHSAAFWAHVDRLYGPHKAARGWLRQHGPGLHALRFD
ncbi:zinc metalloprotease [Oceanicola sp. 22II-s10i]|uniref:M48 family metallopeptidase n=1 Tax=Oceanicola sp. 22II-s10i TaxID=1317116 RepID=UPI000B528F1B|nr:SprT family zinc-dependent metalloprotease [Oceanicola sp. 22II-s10i]OWU86098.1 zinc metalloprotease [Oceanicola sp. 22II-s10i]